MVHGSFIISQGTECDQQDLKTTKITHTEYNLLPLNVDWIFFNLMEYHSHASDNWQKFCRFS